MYALVKLLHGYRKPLWYRIPAHAQNIIIDSVVQVPLRNQTVSALVVNISTQLPCTKGQIREIIKQEKLPQDSYYFPFIKTLSNLYQLDTTYFIQRLHQFIHQKEKPAEYSINVNSNDMQTPLLTVQQEAVCTFIRPQIDKSNHVPVLLHGVTGSGKTEVYKNIIIHALSQNKTVILLLPEVTLAIAFEQRLRNELPTWCIIHGFHSGKTTKEKKMLWQALFESKGILIIGVHLPVFLPIANLGLIIVDEEHEAGYQEKRHPKIHSREAALLKARCSNVPILFGSATPSLRALYAVKQKKWYFFQLTQRFGGNFPIISIAPLRIKDRRPHFWITKQLQEAIVNRLRKKEQVIIFLNRRGYSFFVQCAACSFILSCNQCSVSLTLHEPSLLYCHYCAFSKQLDAACPSCKASEDTFLKKGIGTQQAVSILRELFIGARIARADADVSSKKKEWQKTIHDFEKGTIDILVGTQTIAKGYHFPRVTLVGIIWADLNLHFPSFDATEIALQQLIQVAGRAGRASTNGEVIVQTMNEHDITRYLSETDYIKFYKNEIEARTQVGYPPCLALVKIELHHINETILEQDTLLCAHTLRSLAIQQNSMADILGPVQPIIHKIKNMHMRLIYIKADNMAQIIQLYQNMDQNNYHSTIFFTPIF